MQLIKRIRKGIFWITVRPVFNKTINLYKLSINKIVFINFSGKGYGGNPKYIADEFLQRNSSYDLVWLVTSYDKMVPDKIRQVKINSWAGLYELATAKVWISNIRNHHPIKKRKEQIYLQTWHGSFGPKLVEKDAEYSLSRRYVKEAKRDGEIADAIIADNEFQKKLYQKSFWLSKNVEILCIGAPQNDSLINKNKERDSFRNKYQFGDKFVVLYAPSFRDDHSVDAYRLNFTEILDCFQKKTKKKCMIVVRLHPNAAYKCDFIQYTDTIVNGSMYPEITELSIAADCLITDYSSVCYDFVLLNKPVFLCALDLDIYEKNRGLLKEFYSYPFSLSQSTTQLLKNISVYDEKKYKEAVDSYFSLLKIYGDGHASAKAVDWIESKIKSRNMEMDTVKFSVLLSCMNEPGFDIVNRSNILADCCVINQCNQNQFEVREEENQRIEKYSLDERGISKSRNAAMLRSNADVVLLSDDDEIFVSDLECIVLEQYEKYTEADVIIFNVGMIKRDDRLYKKGWSKPKRLNKFDVLKVASWQISFRRKNIIEKNIFFDEEFGVGSELGGDGEENIFLEDCLRKGLCIQYVPIKIADLKEKSSTWFLGYDKRYFVLKGRAIRRMLGIGWAFLYVVYFSVFKYKLYGKEIGFWKVLTSMIHGILFKKDTIVLDAS